MIRCHRINLLSQRLKQRYILDQQHSRAVTRYFCSDLFQLSVRLAQGRSIQGAAAMKRSRAKSRDDIMALMHVTYIGEDALPLQQNTEM